MNEINLGDKVKDTVTGASGIVVSLIAYLKGSPQAQIEWMDDNASLNSRWFELDRLEAA